MVRRQPYTKVMKSNQIRAKHVKRMGDVVFKGFQCLNSSVIEQDQFAIPHAQYIAEAQEYKYCIICNTLKPLELFDSHSSRKSGRQGECRLCKTIYNNRTR